MPSNLAVNFDDIRTLRILDRAAELEIPLEDLLLQAMQNFLEESDNFA